MQQELGMYCETLMAASETANAAKRPTRKPAIV